MPARLHRILEREADKRGYRGERRDAYIYGTMARIKKRRADRATERQQRSGALPRFREDRPGHYVRIG